MCESQLATAKGRRVVRLAAATARGGSCALPGLPTSSNAATAAQQLLSRSDRHTLDSPLRSSPSGSAPTVSRRSAAPSARPRPAEHSVSSATSTSQHAAAFCMPSMSSGAGPGEAWRRAAATSGSSWVSSSSALQGGSWGPDGNLRPGFGAGALAQRWAGEEPGVGPHSR